MTAELELAFVKRINEAISKMIKPEYKPLKLREKVIAKGTVETVKDLMLKDTTPSVFKRLADMGYRKCSLEYIVAIEPTVRLQFLQQLP